jgi:cell division protein FtsW
MAVNGTARTREHRQNDYDYPLPNGQSGPKPTATIIRGTMDYTIYLVVIILVLIGIVMVFSASYLSAATNPRFADPFHFLIRNIQWAIVGFVAMNILARTPYKFILRIAPAFYAVSIFFLGLVLVYGLSYGGATRWLSIPVIGQFQPSEVAKAAIIFMLGWMIHKDPKILHTWPGFLRCSFLVILSTGLVAYGGMSSAIITALIGFGMIFVASPHIWRFIIAAAGGGGGLVAYLWWLSNNSENFRGGRFAAWLDPFSDPLHYGFQVIQSMYAIASGGLFGLGIGQSRQKTFLPEAHNDIIFAIICEELGLVGAATILLLFGILFWRGIRVALNALDTFSAMAAIGIVLAIASQVIINVAVVTNSIPNTGVTMPFISYGGTSLLVSMAMMGVLLNISRYSKDTL